MTTSPPAPKDEAATPAEGTSKTPAKAVKTAASAAKKTVPPVKKAAPARKATRAVTDAAEPTAGSAPAPTASPEEKSQEKKPAPVVALRAVPAPPASTAPAAEEKKKPGIAALGMAAFRSGQSAIARAVGLVALVVAAVIILGIVLVLCGANPHNGLVKALYGLDGALVHPFAGDLHQPMTTAYLHNQQAVFAPKTIKKFVLENWGLATAVYLGAGLLLARLVRFGKA